MSNKIIKKYLIVLAPLLIIQIWMMSNGYRLTADDIFYHYFPMQGWDVAFSYIDKAAKLHGRFVYYIDLPFMMLGATLVESQWWRIFFAGLHIFCYFSVFFYFERILKLKIMPLALLIFVVLHPIDYFHLPPTSFPTHFAFPILLITWARIGLVDAYGRKDWRVKDALYICLGVFGMFFGEKGFAFALALILFELLVGLKRPDVFGTDSGNRKTVLWKMTAINLVMLSAFLIPYIGYRILHSSNYPGNGVSGLLQPLSVLKTIVGHIYGSTAIPSYSRNFNSAVQELHNLSRPFIGFGILCFLILSFVFSRYLNIFQSTLALNDHRVEKLKLLLIGGALISVVSVLPLAITLQYQAWCVSLNTCIYIDSRYALAGVVIFLVAVISLIMGRRELVGPLSIIIGVLCAALCVSTFVVNFLVSERMKSDTNAWERGRFLACNADAIPAGVRENLSNFIDPNKKISFHPGFNSNDYWRQYINDRQKSEDCSQSKELESKLFPPLDISSESKTNAGSVGAKFLLEGWSSPEGFGVWSSAKRASMILPMVSATKGIDFKLRAFSGGSGQKIRIKINAVDVGEFLVESESVVTVGVPLFSVRDERYFLIDFEIPDAVSPKSLGQSADTRELGVGLISFRLY